MTHLIIEEEIDKSKLNDLIDYIKSLKLNVLIKDDFKKTLKRISNKEGFFHVGMWEGRDINIEQLRRKAWRLDRFDK